MKCSHFLKKIVLKWTIFKVFTEGVTVLLVLLFGHKECGILVPPPGIKLAPLVSEGEVLSPGPLGKSCLSFLKIHQ